MFRIPQDKISEVKELIYFLLKRNKFPVKQLARIVGKISSFARSVGPVARLMTRSCHRVIAAAPTWSSYVTLSDSAIFELDWWAGQIDAVNGFTMMPSCTVDPLVYSTHMVGDASAKGMFLGILTSQRRTLVSQPFTLEESLESSTARELRVFYTFYMESNLSEWRNSSILHYTDSRAAESIITFGSKNPVLQSMVRQIYLKAQSWGITLAASWKRRSEYEMMEADRGSRGPWYPSQGRIRCI